MLELACGEFDVVFNQISLGLRGSSTSNDIGIHHTAKAVFRFMTTTDRFWRKVEKALLDGRTKHCPQCRDERRRQRATYRTDEHLDAALAAIDN